MNTSRIAILGVALVAGGGAFFLMMGNRPSSAPVQIVEPVKEETTRVLVAIRQMTRGERLTVEDTQWVSWPKKAVQPGFITDEDPQARENLLGAAVRSLMVEGEPILEAKVVQAGSSSLMAAILDPGMRAVTVRVSPETSSGGFILPGDRVDLHYAESDNDKANLSLLNENVRVLAVNTIYSENTGTPTIEGRNITVELSPENAEFLMIANNSRGTVQVTLRSIFEPEGEIVSDTRRGEVKVIRYGRS